VASLLIRDLEDDVKLKLRVRAARNGRSMEAEAREILTHAVAAPAREKGVGTRMAEIFADLEPEDRREFQEALRENRRWFAAGAARRAAESLDDDEPSDSTG